MMATEPSSNYVAFILGQLRCASLRTQMQACEIDVLITGLSAGLIPVDTAIAMAGGDLIAVSSITTASTA